MDFIEKWFGISPDGGDGTLEVLWVATLAIAVGAFFFRSRIIGLIERKRKRPA